jgi:hypothetical protein
MAHAVSVVRIARGNAVTEAVSIINVGRRPGLICDEFTAECGCCGTTLWRKASFAKSPADYITCTRCGETNVVRKPKECA